MKAIRIAMLPLGATSLLVLGCATGPEPEVVRPIAQAESKIETAEQADAARHSGELLRSARTHLESARAAADDGDSEEAVRHATQAELDAELAIARADNREAEDAMQELEESLRALRNEIARNEAR